MKRFAAWAGAAIAVMTAASALADGDITPVKAPRLPFSSSSYDVAVNLEQGIAPDLGVFMRAGWADGNVEPFYYTDIDRTVAGGASLNGKQTGTRR